MSAIETVKTLLRAHHRAILEEPIAEDLAAALPIRTITEIEPRAERVIGVFITEARSGRVRSAREMYELAGLMLGWLSITRAAYFNNETDLHYLCVLDGIPFHGVMVGAAAGEEIRLGPDHLVLLPEVFVVEATRRRTTGARVRAVEQALAEWDKSAERLGLTALLSRDRYEELLWEIFALFDARYGYLLKRPGKLAA